MIRRLVIGVLGLVAAAESRAQEIFESLSERLTYVSESGEAWARVSILGDLTGYAFETPAPGLLFTDDSSFVAPRLVMLVDAQLGARLGVHVQARADRGFDPGLERRGDVRADEYYLQADLVDAWRLRLRAGRFRTAFGQWVERHQAWDNPMISAPALYEDMLPVTDAAAPVDLAAFAARRDVPDNKAGWVPIVWGPSYATGAALSAGTGSLDVVVEVKHASLSSRPAVWDEVRDGFDIGSTITGRVAWHPSMEWTLGASFSRGPYLQEAARATLPPGARLDDFEQTTVGVDLTYELHRWQVWAELVRVSFDVPRVGEVDGTSGFVEARYKFAPQFWLAGRWNLARFDDTPGLDRSWDRDLDRFDLALGYRHSNHVQAKLEYGHWSQRGGNTVGKRLVAAQLAFWF